jgi:hypothetical protein
MVESTGTVGLRKEFIDQSIKAIALMDYKLKTLCTIDSSSSYTESFFRETNTDPTTVGVTATTKIKGVSPLAPFPYGEVTWTKVSGTNFKYACEGLISQEDELMGYLPIIERTLIRIGRGVARAEEEEILARMSADYGNTYAITAGNEWDSATVANRDVIFDLLSAAQTLRVDNIDPLTGETYVVVNGTDYTNMISNSKIMNNPTFKAADVVSKGVVGQLVGMKLMVSESVAADTAYLVVKGSAMVWKEVKGLTVEQIHNLGISTTIRAYSYGQCQVVTPNAICKITNTRK